MIYIGLAPEKRFFFDDQGGDVFFLGNPEHPGFRFVGGDQADLYRRIVPEIINDCLGVGAGARSQYDKVLCQREKLEGRSWTVKLTILSDF